MSLFSIKVTLEEEFRLDRQTASLPGDRQLLQPLGIFLAEAPPERGHLPDRLELGSALSS